MKRRAIAAGLALLTIVSGLCLAGLKAIDEKLAKKRDPEQEEPEEQAPEEAEEEQT